MIPRVLVVPPKNEDPAAMRQSMLALVEQALQNGGAIQAFNANKADWKRLRGGLRDAAYRKLASEFDACLVVENELGLLGLGAFDICAAFKDAGKMLGVARTLSTGPRIVLCGVETVDESDWKLRFGRVVLPDAEYLRSSLGTLCSLCRFPQFDTLSGITCKNGHGGALPSGLPPPKVLGSGSTDADEGSW